ncbi:trypsin-1-like [Pollicipes pollicipes]|uniref:trypsin-1-like n=1 Tax=Pollicipes pollicipes TaxID=41117 RepID=UPI001885538B|nr:trypsin-1-like [Pollicipes pollicipes]XP_037092659.1 trypsin-1-like [Pollicipes pollicipes]
MGRLPTLPTLLLLLLLLTYSGHGQNPFKGLFGGRQGGGGGFNLGGFLKFAADETVKAVTNQGQQSQDGQLRLVNPVNAFNAALGQNSNQRYSIGTPFGEFKIGGGQRQTTSSPAPTAATAATRPTSAPTAAPATSPCRGRRCRPQPSGGTSPVQLFQGCGINRRNLATRIVGGQAADPRAWPWMVALLRGTPGFFCGGVLISQWHVLTAAHCVQRFRLREVRVRLGVYDFSNDTEVAGEPLGRMVVHPRYDPVRYRNDVAVLTLARPAQLSDDVWPICLPEPGLDFQNVRATVIGWGTIYPGGPTSSVLRQLTIPVWSQQECDTAYPQLIDDVFLCAGGRQGGRDACQGDSGGPLQHMRSDGSWSVIGLVSWGKRCAEVGFPGVYTRVTRMLRWILRNTA